LCAEAAAKSGANLSGANLSGANLSGADLYDACLSGADGTKIKCVGKRPYLCIGPLGSRCDYLAVWLTDAGVYVKAGCFWDTLAEFKKAVEATHGTTDHGKEYAAAIKLIEAHAKIWRPVRAVEVSGE
jgi:Pentapeptide repeats (8 copies)